MLSLIAQPFSTSTVGAKNGDAIFFAAGATVSSQSLLGAVRLEIGQRCNLIDEKAWKFVWIVDAPMFEPVDAENPAAGWTAVHHPFTGPKPEYANTFDTNPQEALAYAYDIVLNGNEIGGGSIRIHQRDVQQRVFKTIGLSKSEAESKFGFLLEAFNYGPPPHGGIALGLDRLFGILLRHIKDKRVSLCYIPLSKIYINKPLLLVEFSFIVID